MSHRLFLPLMFIIMACSPGMLGRLPTEDVPGTKNVDRDVELGNLAAIKALLAEERRRFAPIPASIASAQDQRLTTQSPGDPSRPASRVPRKERLGSRTDLFYSLPAQRNEPSSQIPAIPPFVSNMRPPADFHTNSWPVVPPYTFYAPTGATYPGAIRCAPDYLGGQRCHQAP